MKNEIPAGFYDKIYQRKAGVRYCWHDLKFRAVAAHLTGAKTAARHRLRAGDLHRQLYRRHRLPGHRLQRQRRSSTPTGAMRPAPIAFRRSRSRVSSMAGERFDAITMIELVEHLAAADAARLFAQARSAAFRRRPPDRDDAQLPVALAPHRVGGQSGVAGELRAAAHQQVPSRPPDLPADRSRLSRCDGHDRRRSCALCRRVRSQAGAVARCPRGATGASWVRQSPAGGGEGHDARPDLDHRADLQRGRKISLLDDDGSRAALGRPPGS